MSIDTTTQTITVDGLDVFYREAGKQNHQVVLLLHGYPSSSFQYRNLIPRLASKYRVIAPDIPGFGFTKIPEGHNYQYTFDNFGKTIEAFTYALNLNRFALYIFDYGAPTGLRLARARPDAITAIISQNGNAYEVGLGDFWDSFRPFWADPSKRESVRWVTSFDATKSQYFTGEAQPEKIAPESYTLDQALLDRPGNADIQLDIFYDYRKNLPLYPAFHEYFRSHQPPLLAVWGKNDNIFIPAGAEAFKKDLPNAKVHLVDGGHFTLENHLEEITEVIDGFLSKALGDV